MWLPRGTDVSVPDEHDLIVGKVDVKDHRYWDWTLDASDLASSLVWDNINGFSGNSDSNNSDCIIDGPFINLTRYWQSKFNGKGFDIIHNPSCLRRGFRTAEKKSPFNNGLQVMLLKKFSISLRTVSSLTNWKYEPIMQSRSSSWVTSTL